MQFNVLQFINAISNFAIFKCLWAMLQLSISYNFIMSENPQKSTKSRVKLSQLQDHSIYSNNLNNSVSKMQYSISKSPRFKQEKRKQSQPQLYQLPSIRSNRSATFGFGNKIDLAKISSDSPPPNSYYIRSEFQLKKNKGIGIGLGREMVKAGSVFGQKSFVVPGVGSYDVKEPKSQQNIKISGRLADLSDKWAKQVPGPGAYKTLDLLNKSMNNQLSNYQNARSYKFSPPKIAEEISHLKKKKNLPGPGHYTASNQSFEFVARFVKRKGASFSKSPRKGITNQSKVPGPGSYKYLSDFIH